MRDVSRPGRELSSGNPSSKLLLQLSTSTPGPASASQISTFYHREGDALKYFRITCIFSAPESPPPSAQSTLGLRCAGGRVGPGHLGNRLLLWTEGLRHGAGVGGVQVRALPRPCPPRGQEQEGQLLLQTQSLACTSGPPSSICLERREPRSKQGAVHGSRERKLELDAEWSLDNCRARACPPSGC